MFNRQVAMGACALVLAAGCAPAQTIPAGLPATELHAMVQQAEVIFAGQVSAVRRKEANGGATGVVEIDFLVEDAVLGVRGGSYTLREWSGLWPANDAPFRAGQRYLMLLHPAGASGLSSPVGGTDGAIPIHGARDGGNVDLRWVGTRAVTPLNYAAAPARARPIARPILSRPDAEITAITDGAEVLPQPVLGDGPGSAVPGVVSPQQMSYAKLLTMLRAWEREDHGAR